MEHFSMEILWYTVHSLVDISRCLLVGIKYVSCILGSTNFSFPSSTVYIYFFHLSCSSLKLVFTYLCVNF